MCVFIHAHLHMCIHMCICIVEKAGILEPGQSGGRQGRSTDINLTKLEWVTREALAQGKRLYRVDVDFTNAFNAMSQAALWAVMRAYGIPEQPA